MLLLLWGTQVMEKGMRFTMRDGGHTLGYGVVTDLLEGVNMEEYEINRRKEKKALKKALEAAGGM